MLAQPEPTKRTGQQAAARLCAGGSNLVGGSNKFAYGLLGCLYQCTGIPWATKAGL
ncbi:hypothetical protein BX600DRAFT_456407, partial [Xylariales sp. PMI_506]